MGIGKNVEALSCLQDGFRAKRCVFYKVCLIDPSGSASNSKTNYLAQIKKLIDIYVHCYLLYQDISTSRLQMT